MVWGNFRHDLLDWVRFTRMVRGDFRHDLLILGKIYRKGREVMC